jgi:hypothetical protein
MEVHPMKRNLDLARHLLLDIEARGADCSISALRAEGRYDDEEQIRYHLRLLLDTGLLKEIDRTSAGVPCVRLTHDGHELIELARHEGRWNEARYLCQQCTGGLALEVVRNILYSWAMAGSHGRPAVARGWRVPGEYVRPRLPYGLESFAGHPRWYGGPYWDDDAPRPLGSPTEYAAMRREGRYGVDLDGDGRADIEYDATLPGYLI